MVYRLRKLFDLPNGQVGSYFKSICATKDTINKMETQHRPLGGDTCNTFNNKEFHKQKIHKENLQIHRKKADNQRVKYGQNGYRQLLGEAPED